jgi:chromosome condensin MukBEF ATPase and DNA-binding subunit MukB
MSPAEKREALEEIELALNRLKGNQSQPQ